MNPLNKEDHETEIGLANELLQPFRPGGRVRSMTRLDGGVVSRVFDLVCEQPPEHVVLKVYPTSERWLMEYEVFIFGLLQRETSVPTPRIFYSDRQHRLVPDDYVLMEKVEGAAIAHHTGLKDPDYRDLYRQIGRILRAMHAVELPAFGYLEMSGPVENWPTNREFMTEWFRRALANFNEHGGDPRLGQAIAKRVQSSGAIFNRCDQAALCHNDLHEANAIAARRANGWHLTGIVDVGGAIAADPLFDVARTDYWSTRGNPIKRQALLEGYGVSLSDSDVKAALGVYEMYHALELRNWFARAGDYPETVDRIASELNRLAAQ